MQPCQHQSFRRFPARFTLTAWSVSLVRPYYGGVTDDAADGITANPVKAVADDMPAPQALNNLLRAVMHPALKAGGMRRSGRTWREGDADRGWVLIQVQGSKFNTREQVELTINTSVWPPATWEMRREVSGHEEALPYVAGDAPFFARPDVIAPERPGAGQWWQLDSGTDVDALATGLVDFVLQDALPWARRHRNPDQAVKVLHDKGGFMYAIAILRRTATGSAQLRDLVEEYTSTWISDPRPITLRPHLIQWRQEAGLPEVPLPEVWSPSMSADLVTEFGSPEAARAAGYGIYMYSWDGRTWQDRG